MAKRILIAQGVLVGLAVIGLVVKEYPGLVRELKIWRMAFLLHASGSRRVR